MTKTDNSYTCAKCNGVFDKAWSDEEAENEYAEKFPEEKATAAIREIICDDCYKIIMNQ